MAQEPVKDDYHPLEQLAATDFNKVAKIVNKGSTVFYNSLLEVDLTQLKRGDWVRVESSEANNLDKSMYLFNGTSLEFQYTII